MENQTGLLVRQDALTLLVQEREKEKQIEKQKYFKESVVDFLFLEMDLRLEVARKFVDSFDTLDAGTLLRVLKMLAGKQKKKVKLEAIWFFICLATFLFTLNWQNEAALPLLVVLGVVGVALFFSNLANIINGTTSPELKQAIANLENEQKPIGHC